MLHVSSNVFHAWDVLHAFEHAIYICLCTCITQLLFCFKCLCTCLCCLCRCVPCLCTCILCLCKYVLCLFLCSLTVHMVPCCCACVQYLCTIFPCLYTCVAMSVHITRTQASLVQLCNKFQTKCSYWAWGSFNFQEPNNPKIIEFQNQIEIFMYQKGKFQ